MDGEAADSLRTGLARRLETDDVNAVATLQEGVRLAFHADVRVVVVDHHAVARDTIGHRLS
jgi:hypothetical protein